MLKCDLGHGGVCTLSRQLGALKGMEVESVGGEGGNNLSCFGPGKSGTGHEKGLWCERSWQSFYISEWGKMY